MGGFPLDSTSPFAGEFRAYADQAAKNPPPPDPILFYGSSSIRLWASLKRDFAGLPVVNRGFGGSMLAECVQEMDRLVYPLKPKAIVLYAGENDLDQGRTPDQVLAAFHAFMAGVRQRLGSIPVLVLAVKPSPARFSNSARMRRTNELLQGALPGWQPAYFLDTFHAMLRPDGQPRQELFGDDWLHLSAAGYSLWKELVWGWLRERGLAT